MGHLFQIAGSFPVIYISQCSVSTCLRCDGIFNDQFITQSLLNPRVKKKLKIGQHLLKLRAIKYRVVFLWNTVYMWTNSPLTWFAG